MQLPFSRYLTCLYTVGCAEGYFEGLFGETITHL